MAVWNVIDHTELTTATTEYDVTSIPSSYDHLCLAVSARSDASQTYTNINGEINADTGSNYSRTYLYAATSTPAVSSGSGASNMTDLLPCPAANVLADTFNTGIIWIPNYANTANYKQVLAQGTRPNNSTTNWDWEVRIGAHLWASTTAINQLTLSLSHGDFVQYSTFTLYGINGAA